MSIELLVQSAFSAPLTEAKVEEACAATKSARPELFDAFAREIVSGFEKKKYAWSDCDAAMNALFVFAYAVSASSLPDYAYRVYIAFDGGEIREGGEAVTQKLLAEIR